MSLLDFIWGAIKGVVTDWLFGAKGDNQFEKKQKRVNDKSNFTNMNKELAVGQRDASMLTLLEQ